jgi:hypothetical protein
MSVDPETVHIQPTYRVGFSAPVPGSLAAGELYVEVAPPGGGAPRVWVGTMEGTEDFPGNIASLIPLGVELPPPLPASAPINVDVPYLGGNGTIGETLTCTMGNWEGEPETYAYAWLRDGEQLGSGEANTYDVTQADAGHAISCVVTATNARGSTQAPPSNAVEVPAAAAAAAGAKPPPPSHDDDDKPRPRHRG